MLHCKTYTWTFNDILFFFFQNCFRMFWCFQYEAQNHFDVTTESYGNLMGMLSRLHKFAVKSKMKSLLFILIRYKNEMYNQKLQSAFHEYNNGVRKYAIYYMWTPYMPQPWRCQTLPHFHLSPVWVNVIK